MLQCECPRVKGDDSGDVDDHAPVVVHEMDLDRFFRGNEMGHPVEWHRGI